MVARVIHIVPENRFEIIIEMCIVFTCSFDTQHNNISVGYYYITMSS